MDIYCFFVNIDMSMIVQGAMDKFLPYYFFNFAHACCLLLVFSTVQYSSDSEKKSTLSQFTLQKIWKRHAEKLGILTGISNKNISECLSIKLRTVQRILKKFDESNGDYKGVWWDHCWWRRYTSVGLHQVTSGGSATVV